MSKIFFFINSLQKISTEKIIFHNKKIMSTMITLSCLIQCDYPNEKNIFRIEIENNESVSKLKEEIRKKKYNNFVSVDADELQLWKVNIPLDEQNYKFN